MTYSRIFAALAATSLTAAPLAAQATQPAKAPPTRAELSQSLADNFKRADTNGDGTLVKAEVDAIQQRAADSAAAALRTRMDQEFGRLDTDKSGQLSRAEFIAAAPSPRVSPGDTTLARVDADKNGKVTLDEYRSLMLAAFDGIDTNRDGIISDAERRAGRTASR